MNEPPALVRPIGERYDKSGHKNGDEAHGVATREELLAETFVELADTLVDDFDVIELLTMLSERCVELLGAAGTGILLGDAHDRLQMIAASSEQAQLLELFQLQNQEGPCLDCYQTGLPVIHPDLGTANPWPRFGVVALKAGLPSVHAFPMRLRDRVVGTLSPRGPGQLRVVLRLGALGHWLSRSISPRGRQQLVERHDERLGGRRLAQDQPGLARHLHGRHRGGDTRPDEACDSRLPTVEAQPRSEARKRSVVTKSSQAAERPRSTLGVCQSPDSVTWNSMRESLTISPT
ncbi:MAG: GAF domain-containing protein [Acidimicrobiales bacterium]